MAYSVWFVESDYMQSYHHMRFHVRASPLSPFERPARRLELLKKT